MLLPLELDLFKNVFLAKVPIHLRKVDINFEKTNPNVGYDQIFDKET
jgi:hypothetical protein